MREKDTRFDIKSGRLFFFGVVVVFLLWAVALLLGLFAPHPHSRHREALLRLRHTIGGLNERMLPLTKLQVADKPLLLTELSDAVEKHFDGRASDFGLLVRNLLAKEQLVDPWGNSYLIQITPISPSDAKVRIISTGANGVFDRCKKDDDFVEVDWPL